MVVSPTELGTKNHCAGEGQQQFTRQQNFLRLTVCHPKINTSVTVKMSRVKIASVQVVKKVNIVLLRPVTD
jgi:hypothetical protein